MEDLFIASWTTAVAAVDLSASRCEGGLGSVASDVTGLRMLQYRAL